MKLLVSLVALLTTFLLMISAQGLGGYVHLSGSQVNAALAKATQGGKPVGATSLTKTADYEVHYAYRTEGTAEQHDNRSQIFIVTEGRATLVLGGQLTDKKTMAPNVNDDFRGSGIENGQTYDISKGSVISIPIGTPHWVKEAHPSVTYYAIDVFKR